MQLLKRDCTSGLVIEVLMTRIRLSLILYFFMVAYKAACQSVLKAFLKSVKTCKEVGLLEVYEDL